MANVDEAKTWMEEGWQAREALDFETAHTKLEAAKTAFIETGDYKEVTEALNHLAYTHKLEATQHAAKAYQTAQESLKVAEDNNIDPSLVYRALISTAETLGLYEVALQHANQMLPLLQKPILQGDLLSHIATFELRTGNAEQAKDTIEKALSLIQEGWETEREPHRSIWKVRAFMTQALITYNLGNKVGALEILHGALDIAKEKDLKPRIQQIEMLISSL